MPKIFRKEGLFMDVSKVFDCLSHELITAMLNAFGFGLNSLKKFKTKKSKINDSYSSWEEVLFGVLQGSILGPILFNIFLSNLFIIIKDTNFASYADDNTFYKASNTIDDVIAYFSSHLKSSTNGFQIIR